MIFFFFFVLLIMRDNFIYIKILLYKKYTEKYFHALNKVFVIPKNFW